MITFVEDDGKVVLVYSSDQLSPSWVDDRLKAEGHVTLSRVFTVRKEDLLAEARSGDLDYLNEDIRCFLIGTIDDEYRTIRKDVLGLKFDLLVAESINLDRQMFIAYRDISVFRKIDKLVDEQIVVGGSRESAIPEEEFFTLLHHFPTSTELTHYASTRVTRVLREYMGTMSDAEQRLTNYMERRALTAPKTWGDPYSRTPMVNELELEKFKFVQERLTEMLKDTESYSEANWQEVVADLFLLVFPQYIAVLHNVKVKDYYSGKIKSTNRFIDLMLIKADGCVDIIEIKKPFDRALVTKNRYRDNHVPTRELSGSIMQAEKYLFHLSKSGTRGEDEISSAHASSLPPCINVRITNPKAIILAGRDVNLSAREKFDFEVIRRKYSNIVDIISYDDLLRRLNNMIEALIKRSVTAEKVIWSPEQKQTLKD